MKQGGIKIIVFLGLAAASPVAACQAPGLPGSCPASLNTLATQSDTREGKRIRLDWTYDLNDLALSGVLIVRSTEPITFQPEALVIYHVGQKIGGARVVYNAPAWTQTYTDTGLEAFQDYHYAAFSRDGFPFYASGISSGATALPALDQKPPLETAGLKAARAGDGRGIRIEWSAGEEEDLTAYQVWRSTALEAEGVLATVLHRSATSYLDAVDPEQAYFYRVRALDFSGNRSNISTILEVSGHPAAWFVQDAACIGLRGLSAQKMTAAQNPFGKDAVFSVQRKREEENGVILRSFEIRAAEARTGSRVQKMAFNPEEFEIVLGYADENFPLSGFSAQRRAAGIKPSSLENPAGVGVYWFNGVEWTALPGSVDGNLKTVTVRQPHTGLFQVRRDIRVSGFDMTPSDVQPRLFSPNGDGKNDRVFFYFRKSAGVQVAGKILDVNGAFVADLNSAGPVPEGSLQWDGRDFNGSPAGPGIYIYILSGAGNTSAGRVVLAR